jgi:FMN phosphatase YigB (HAD superfamily)
MEKIINFDMDGTLADFYGVEGWLDFLMNEDTTPYEKAKPLFDTTELSALLNELQQRGYEINIISWGSKNSTKEFLKATESAKIEWLKKYFDVTFDNIFVVPYGTPKDTIKRGVLFDDNNSIRTNYNGVSFKPQSMMSLLYILLYK